MPAIEESWLEVAKTLGYENEREMLLQLYQEFSINEIAKIIGYTAWSVRRRLLEQGVQLRSRGGPNKLGKRALINVSDEELASLSQLELAAKYKVCVATVYAERRLRRPCTSVQ
jgi:hypothetical protein